MAFVKGQSGCPTGRPKGIIDKRMRLNKALLADADELLEVTKAKALDGDMGAMALLLPRVMPVLKPEGSLVQFTLDSKASAAVQIESVMAAVADGNLTIEQGHLMVAMIRQRAEVIALEGAGDGAAQVVDALRAFAQGVEERTRAPYVCDTPVRETVVTTAPPPEAPKALGTPRTIRKSDGSVVPSANYTKPNPEQVQQPKPWEVRPPL